jgi:predicted ATPase
MPYSYSPHTSKVLGLTEIQMNIIQTLTARIEDYRATNKQPCKNYSTKEAAEKATAKMAQAAGKYFDAQNREDAASARYVVFFVEPWGRWVGAIELSELLHRPNSTGGYLGFCRGFYTF